MSDEKRLNLLEKVAIVMFAALIAYFVLTFGLSLSGLDHSWPYPMR
ncbi:Uncharacterised protein [Serratia rubidaea]|uniref:Uncharacterized protein n=1 Tax=Serratia rubidaea TaxID=61652 RepID=A0A447QVM4_SERRU|nr:MULTISPECIES: hypothetical protein [Serratia]AGB82754.1 hypothetical protein D781_2494 [Serratia sp. FGI94]AML58332.1 hypothetical protein AXX16_2633 [Serratia rubidaea]MBD8452831.1 hypothetical protein [Serratia rubidaea]MBS0972257.1 hypothetical protein [Serratia rubidaea]MDC6110592.1 hypothetical protein [Serratia rubidaea]